MSTPNLSFKSRGFGPRGPQSNPRPRNPDRKHYERVVGRRTLGDIEGLDPLIAELRNRCAMSGSIRAWCQAAGFPITGISSVLNRRRMPGHGLCEALGFERVTVVRRKA